MQCESLDSNVLTLPEGLLNKSKNMRNIILNNKALLLELLLRFRVIISMLLLSNFFSR